MPPKAKSLQGMTPLFDVGGIAHLPGNLSEMPVGSLRLLLLPTGKTVRQPQAGMFVCSAPFAHMLAPCIAVFSEESGLGERLVMQFTDYSLGPQSNMSGLGFMCHEFPLAKRANKFKDDSELIICNLEHCTELKEVDHTDLKYKDVHDTLKASGMMKVCGITKPDGVQSLKFVKGAFLERVSKLAANAKLAAKAQAKDLLTYNRADGEKKLGVCEALINKLVSEFQAR